MVTVSRRMELDCGIEKVWDIVTSLKEYSWRSDLSRIEIVDEKNFIEYAKNGYATNFHITEMDYCKTWGFDIDNTNISGHWSGLFRCEGEKVILEFTECIEAKKWFMRPFIKGYLKSQQKKYEEDLKKVCKK